MLSPEDLTAIGNILDEKLKKFATKADLEQIKADIISEIAVYVADNLNPLLDNHEKRLEHLEQHSTQPPGRAAT